MAISTRKKNLVIADWKTGAYSLNSLAKKHKISTFSVKKICSKIPQDNADVVELCTAAESAKKQTKNKQEILAVEEVVNNRLKVYEISNTILDGVDKLVKRGKAQKVVTESLGESGSSATVVEYDLQAKDYKELQDAVDKASLTLGVNARHAQNQVNIQNNNKNEQNNVIRVEYID
jgi:hypothetical protein